MKMERISSFGVFVFALVAIMLPSAVHAGSSNELYPLPFETYEKKWCRDHSGASQVKMPDGTIAGCITSTHAVAFEFARNWKDAVGHALYISLETGKKAGIVLIIENEKDLAYVKLLDATIAKFKLSIDVWKQD